jgi:hypothetical protein
MFKKILITLLMMISISSTFVSAQNAPIRIQFQQGSISAEWRGSIQRGVQDFYLRLGRYQNFTLESGDVYSWSMVAPNGQVLGCNGSSYCAPGESIFLPMTGDYRVQTSYRMSDCANCPVATSRRVNLVFIAR